MWCFSEGFRIRIITKTYEHWQLISFAIWSLNKSGHIYWQLGKEILFVIFFGITFHDYIYGKPFQIYNNHLPLKWVLNWLIVKAPRQTQCFILPLQKYNFEMHYIQGSILTVEDTRSEATLSQCYPKINENNLNCFVHSVILNYLISVSRLE